MIMHSSFYALAALWASVARADIIPVQVGFNQTLRYNPEYVSAKVGDTVVFTFVSKNHTVTQSNFNEPCVYNGGSNSGFQPFVNTTQAPSFSVDVTATTPMWFYCQQIAAAPIGSHCGQGMVFAINPDESSNSTKTFEDFQALAMQINGTGSTTSTTTMGSSSTYTPPPPQSSTVTTATVSSGSSTWTTTYTSYYGTPSPSYNPNGPVTHVVQVGATGLNFTPPIVQAQIGDIVQLFFHPKNHTFTRSTFEAPCVPIEQTTGNSSLALSSGFMFVSNTTDPSDFPSFSFVINDTAPIWAYCAQPGPPAHCGQGMVLAINSVESGPNNFAAFKQLAEQLNGTSTSSGSNPTSTGSTGSSGKANNGGYTSTSVHGASVAMAILAAIAYAL